MRTTWLAVLALTLRCVSAAPCIRTGGPGACGTCGTATLVWNPTYQNCYCPEGQGFNAAGDGCVPCNSIAAEYDPVTGNCVCASPKAFNSQTSTGSCISDCGTGFARGPGGVCAACVAPANQVVDNICVPNCQPDESLVNNVCEPCSQDLTKDLINGQCVAKCPQDQVRDGIECANCTTNPLKELVGDKCLDRCGDNQVRVGDECKDCAFDSTKELFDGKCVPKCTGGQVRNNAGDCVDPSTSSSTPVVSTSPSPDTSAPVTTAPETTAPESTAPETTTPPPDTTAPTDTTTGPAPTQTSGRLPAEIGDFDLVGCTGSTRNYPSFSLMTSSLYMTLEMCTLACSDYLYAGVHVEDCYCANSFDSVETVARDQCSVPCPGNPLETCGGYRAVVRRQSVPSDALLVVYINLVLAGTSSVTGISTTTTTTSTTESSSDISTTTNTDTTTTTTVTTATPVPTDYPCVHDYCHPHGYWFELCDGFPRPGEIVFVLQPCGCYGGWQYVQASCDGAGCGSLAVYRLVPYTESSSQASVTIYQPQPCNDCTGGVTFVQPPPASSGGSGSSSGSTGGGSPVVVTAGASKVAEIISSLMVFIGAFALLI